LAKARPSEKHAEVTDLSDRPAVEEDQMRETSMSMTPQGPVRRLTECIALAKAYEENSVVRRCRTAISSQTSKPP
jgi:hypothetical protein